MSKKGVIGYISHTVIPGAKMGGLELLETLLLFTIHLGSQSNHSGEVHAHLVNGLFMITSYILSLELALT